MKDAYTPEETFQEFPFLKGTNENLIDATEALFGEVDNQEVGVVLITKGSEPSDNIALKLSELKRIVSTIDKGKTSDTQQKIQCDVCGCSLGSHDVDGTCPAYSCGQFCGWLDTKFMNADIGEAFAALTAEVAQVKEEVEKWYQESQRLQKEMTSQAAAIEALKAERDNFRAYFNSR